MAILTIPPPRPAKLPDGKHVVIQPPAHLIHAGPIIQVTISVFQAIAKQKAAAGKDIPQPAKGFALIDTGAASTCVDEKIAQHLGLNVVSVVKLNSATHSDVERNVYPVTFEISGIKTRIDCPMAIGVPLNSQGYCALIGRDILARATLFYNGTTGHITLSFYDDGPDWRLH